MLKLFLLFTLLPLIELWVLIELGRWIGTWPTIFLVASTGFAGVLLAKSQGLFVLRKMWADLEQGIIPGDKIFDGVCILLGGALLLTPGLLTDLSGFCLLIPFTRRRIKSTLRRYLQRKLDSGSLNTWRRW
jgi:UPF0716 protein FxsA